MSAAAELGLPAVVKSAVPGAHKTETGGVAVGLESEAEVREAAERIGLPVLVQPLIGGSAELLAGVVQDPVFGPLVAFGPGGIFAELIGQAAFRIAPLTDVDVHELVTEGKAGALVRGFRGKEAADVGALEDLVHRLSVLGDDLPRARRARPQSGHCGARRLRRRRRADPRRARGAAPHAQDLVAAFPQRRSAAARIRLEH